MSGPPTFARPLIPREHGAWAMVVAPVVVGSGATAPGPLHLLLLVASVLAYMGSFALLEAIRRRSARGPAVLWLAVYLVLSLACFAPLLLRHPELLWLALGLPIPLASALVFTRLRRERMLVNGLLPMAGLALGAIAAARLGGAPLWGAKALGAYGIVVTFFTGSVLFVKSMVRRRKDRPFAYISWVYHAAAVVAASAVLGLLAGAALAPSLLRAIVAWGRPLKPKHLGVIEIVNVLWFTACAIVALRA